MNDEEYALFLRTYRLHRGLTLAEAAEEARVGVNALRHAEEGGGTVGWLTAPRLNQWIRGKERDPARRAAAEAVLDRRGWDRLREAAVSSNIEELSKALERLDSSGEVSLSLLSIAIERAKSGDHSATDP